MLPPPEQVPPLIQLLQALPGWVTHAGTGLGGALLALVGAYLALAKDVTYIKGKVDLLSNDHDMVRMTHEDVVRLKRRFARFEKRPDPSTLSQPNKSLY